MKAVLYYLGVIVVIAGAIGVTLIVLNVAGVALPAWAMHIGIIILVVGAALFAIYLFSKWAPPPP